MREGERYIFKKDDNSNRYGGLIGSECVYIGRPYLYFMDEYGMMEFKLDDGLSFAVSDSAEFELLEGKT